MSLENAKALLDLLLSDKEMQEQFATVTSKEEALNLAVDLGSQKNLSFTKEEIEEFLTKSGYVIEDDGSLSGGNQAAYVEEGELDEEALEAVAGGGPWGCGSFLSCRLW